MRSIYELTSGVVVKVCRLWFLRSRPRPLQVTGGEGAGVPHIVWVEYLVDGQTYRCRKYLDAFTRCPGVGEQVSVSYDLTRPKKCVIEE